MTYIINPWFFYWLQVSSTVRTVLCLLACFAGMALIFAVVVKMGSIFEGEDEQTKDAASRFLKITILLFVPLLLAYVLLPSRDTLLSMQIAGMATTENAELALSAIQNAVDYLVESFRELM